MRIWLKLRVTFELREVKPTIKMSKEKSKQRRRGGVRKGERSEHEEVPAEDKGENTDSETGDWVKQLANG